MTHVLYWLCNVFICGEAKGKQKWYKDSPEEPLIFRSSIPHQIDESLKEQQVKYLKSFKTLDRVFYLVGKQGILYRWTYVTAARKEKLYKIQEMS